MLGNSNLYMHCSRDVDRFIPVDGVMVLFESEEKVCIINLTELTVSGNVFSRYL